MYFTEAVRNVKFSFYLILSKFKGLYSAKHNIFHDITPSKFKYNETINKHEAFEVVYSILETCKILT